MMYDIDLIKAVKALKLLYFSNIDVEFSNYYMIEFLLFIVLHIIMYL